jgi:hypothetical protein
MGGSTYTPQSVSIRSQAHRFRWTSQQESSPRGMCLPIKELLSQHLRPKIPTVSRQRNGRASRIGDKEFLVAVLKISAVKLKKKGRCSDQCKGRWGGKLSPFPSSNFSPPPPSPPHSLTHLLTYSLFLFSFSLSFSPDHRNPRKASYRWPPLHTVFIASMS